MEEKAYDRETIKSLFQVFYYVEKLAGVPVARSFAEIVNPTFYSSNVSWTVQRNGNHKSTGMMVSKNASLGNHSHANGINLELYAKGMVIVPDCAAGVSYWSDDHREYYSRFPAHNTVIVDGLSDYRTMNSTHAFELQSIYPAPSASKLMGHYTFDDVTFLEPASQALQQRLTGTIRTSDTSGYFVDIFRSRRQDNQDLKHEYLLHGLGDQIQIRNASGAVQQMYPTEDLSSAKGDLVGYDYFENKLAINSSQNLVAHWTMPRSIKEAITTKVWIKGETDRTIFTVTAPPSRAQNPESVPVKLFKQGLPTLVVRQKGEAQTRPFVAIIDAFTQENSGEVVGVSYFGSNANDSTFVGVSVTSQVGQQDYIYNHPDVTDHSKLDDGEFHGKYGIISFKAQKAKSIFLHGLVLVKDGYSIATEPSPGMVNVLVGQEGVQADADVRFELTLPESDFKDWRKKALVKGDQRCTASVVQRRGIQVIRFAIPPGSGIWKIKP